MKNRLLRTSCVRFGGEYIFCVKKLPLVSFRESMEHIHQITSGECVSEAHAKVIQMLAVVICRMRQKELDKGLN